MVFFCISSLCMYSPLNLFGYLTLNKHYYYYYKTEFARCLISTILPHHLMLLADSVNHLPILIRLQMKASSNPGLCRTYVILKKANCNRYRQEIKAALSKRSLPTDCQRDERSSVQFYLQQPHTTSLLDVTESMRNLYQQRYWM